MALVAVAECSDPQQARAALPRVGGPTLVDRRASVRSNRDDSISGARRRRDASAVIDALLAGAYESGLRRRSALDRDFGLRVDHLGGEVVIVDGETIECTLDGLPVADGGRRHPPVRDRVLDFLTSRASAWASRTSRASRHPSESALTSRNCSSFDGVLSEVRVRVTPVSIIRSRGSPR